MQNQKIGGFIARKDKADFVLCLRGASLVWLGKSSIKTDEEKRRKVIRTDEEEEPGEVTECS